MQFSQAVQPEVCLRFRQPMWFKGAIVGLFKPARICLEPLISLWWPGRSIWHGSRLSWICCIFGSGCPRCGACNFSKTKTSSLSSLFSLRSSRPSWITDLFIGPKLKGLNSISGGKWFEWFEHFRITEGNLMCFDSVDVLLFHHVVCSQIWIGKWRAVKSLQRTSKSTVATARRRMTVLHSDRTW